MSDHIQGLKKQPNHDDLTVHIVDPDRADYTVCGFKYISDHVLNGHRIPMAASTTLPANCNKCKGALVRLTPMVMRNSLGLAEREDVWLLARKLGRQK